jgi:hypothetical protein
MADGSQWQPDQSIEMTVAVEKRGVMVLRLRNRVQSQSRLDRSAAVSQRLRRRLSLSGAAEPTGEKAKNLRECPHAAMGARDKEGRRMHRL